MRAPLRVVFFPWLLLLWLDELTGEYDPNIDLLPVRERQGVEIDCRRLSASNDSVNIVILEAAVLDIDVGSGRDQLGIVEILES